MVTDVEIGRKIRRYFQRRALMFTKYRVRSGRLPNLRRRRVLCKCGARALHYDHRDYTRPDLVTPVCPGCNRRLGPARIDWETVMGILLGVREQMNPWEVVK